MLTQHTHSGFDYIGSDISLDFTNTVSGWREVSVDGELLGSYSRLVEWASGSQIIDQHQSEILLERAERDPEEAQAVLERALAFREALYRIFVACITNRAPRQRDLELLNREVAAASCRLRLAPAGNSFHYELDLSGDNLDLILYPVARSAAELMVSGNLSRLKQCAGDTCGWLFIDRSKNQSRRWCDMKDCGNEAKVRRFRSKKKAA